MMNPTVNINGTSADALYQQQRAVYKAAAALVHALNAASPHPRDYPNATPEEFAEVRNTWRKSVTWASVIRDNADEISHVVQE